VHFVPSLVAKAKATGGPTQSNKQKNTDLF